MDIVLKEVSIERLIILGETSFYYSMDINSETKELGTARYTDNYLEYFCSRSEDWVYWSDYNINIEQDNLKFYIREKQV